MNKKEYIKPEVEIVEIGIETLIAMSFKDDEVDTEGGQLGHYRRGRWGNLWDEGE